MPVQEIATIDQFAALFESDKTFFVDFYANWCGPCRQISPYYEKLAEEHAREGVEFYKLNIDDMPELSGALGVRSIPAFHAYKNKERLRPVVGADRVGLKTLVQARLS